MYDGNMLGYDYLAFLNALMCCTMALCRRKAPQIIRGLKVLHEIMQKPFCGYAPRSGVLQRNYDIKTLPHTMDAPFSVKALQGFLKRIWFLLEGITGLLEGK